MTKYDICDMIKAPIHPMGADCALLHKRRLAHPLNPYANPNRGEVVQMWKKQIFKVICFLAGFAVLMYLSAINAC